MRTAIDAAAEKGDYDTALINFNRALSITDSDDARRGRAAAIMAKDAKKSPQKYPGISDYTLWVKISGVRSSFD